MTASPRFRPLAPRLAALILVALAATPGAAPARDARQQADIHALVQEFDYLIDHGERLAARYAKDGAPIRFNYRALLAQLRLTRDRAAAYLNEAHQAPLAEPPRPDGGSLTRRR